MEVLKSFDWFKIGLVIGIILLSNALFKKCESEKLQLANVDALNSEAVTYKLRNGQLATSQKALVYSNSQLNDLVISKDKAISEISSKFSKVKTITKVITETKLDTIRLIYKDTIPCVFKRKGELITNEYHIDYTSTQKEFTIDYLSIPDSLTIVTGLKRKWFLGKETQTIDVIHSNKYINNGKLNYYEVVQPKKWYQTTLFKVGVGVLLGGLILR